MKKYLIYFKTGVLVIMISLVSCKKESSGGEGGGGSEGGEPLLIHAIIENGDYFDGRISTIKALLGNDKKVNAIATATCENNEFEITLPGTISGKYLYSWPAGFKGTISDPRAKIGGTSLRAYDSKNKEIGDVLNCSLYGNGSVLYFVFYYYADRDVTITGNMNNEYSLKIEFDLSFKKGWNLVYEKIVFNEEKYDYFLTTQEPSDVIFKWYCSDVSMNPSATNIFPFTSLR